MRFYYILGQKREFYKRKRKSNVKRGLDERPKWTENWERDMRENLSDCSVNVFYYIYSYI
jgi:hypothetical protein